MTRSHEVLEHTADLGLLGRGSSMEEAFAAVGEGIAEVTGSWFPGEGDDRALTLEGPDREALLARWVDELLYLHDAEDVVFGGVDVQRVTDSRLQAIVRVGPRGDRVLDDVGVKAATYHRLTVAREADGSWTARVYLDV